MRKLFSNLCFNPDRFVGVFLCLQLVVSANRGCLAFVTMILDVAAGKRVHAAERLARLSW